MIVGLHSFKGGSGKTFIALNLGHLISSKKKVCLIEMDLRAPSFHTFFKCKRYINDLLRKKDDVRKYLVEVKRNLFIIPASPMLRDIRGDIIRRDSESIRILKRLVDIVSEIKSLGFDYVFIDNPPGLSYTSINSMIVSDVIILVSRPEKAEIKGLELLLEISENVEKPKYIVLNRVAKDISINLPVVAKIPCSCDVNMDYPFFVELNKDHKVTKALKELSEFILKL